jgi:hypothetical protein
MINKLIITLEEAIAESEAKLRAINKEYDKSRRIHEEITERFKTERDSLYDIKVLHKALKKAEKQS